MVPASPTGVGCPLQLPSPGQTSTPVSSTEKRLLQGPGRTQSRPREPGPAERTHSLAGGRRVGHAAAQRGSGQLGWGLFETGQGPGTQHKGKGLAWHVADTGSTPGTIKGPARGDLCGEPGVGSERGQVWPSCRN